MNLIKVIDIFMENTIESKKERLNKVFDYLKFEEKLGTQKNFATALDRDKSNISQALKGNEMYLTDSLLEDVCNKFPQLNIEWLTTGKGEMLKEKPFINEVEAVPEDRYMMAEYADLRGQGGKLGGADATQLPETHRRLVPREYEKGNYLVVRVSGNSMYDGTSRSLSDGDEILIRELDGAEWNNLPIRTRLFVITSREGNVVKQIKEVNKEEGYIICHSFNDAFDDFSLKMADIYQIFVVYKIVQKQITLE